MMAFRRVWLSIPYLFNSLLDQGMENKMFERRKATFRFKPSIFVPSTVHRQLPDARAISARVSFRESCPFCGKRL